MLWTQQTGLQATQKLPRVVYLPPVVAQFCAEEQHTFWEAHGHMDKLIEEEIIDEEQGKFLKMWLQANCQGDIDDQALQGLSAINGSRDFTKWCFDHLNTFLRMEHDNHWSQRAIGASDTEIATVLRDMSANLRGMTQDRGNGVADTVGSAKEVAIKPYSVYETAALMGFCGITDKTQIPVIWGLFKTSKEVKDHRLNIAKRMAVWLGANGIPIDHSISSSRKQSRTSSNCAPTQAAERGPSILACLLRVLGVIESIRIKEAAAEESKSNQTLKEAKKLASAESREPPHDLLTLKSRQATDT